MIVCGIEIKGSQAILVSLDGSQASYKVVGLYLRRIKLDDHKDQAQVKSFLTTILAYSSQEKIERIGIRARAASGSFAGGGVSFKIEGIIQTQNVPVAIIAPQTLKARMATVREMPDELTGYQKNAYDLAYYLLGQQP